MNTSVLNNIIQTISTRDADLGRVLSEFLTEITNISKSNEEVGVTEKVEGLRLVNNEALISRNQQDSTDIKLLMLNNLNQIKLGDKYQAKFTGEYHVIIPTVESGDLPPANPDYEGLLVVNRTGNTLIFYTLAGRYFIAGTGF